MKDFDEILLRRGHYLMLHLPCNRDGNHSPLIYVCMFFESGEKGEQTARKYAEEVISNGGMPVFPFQMYKAIFPETNRLMVSFIQSMALRILKECDEVWVFGDRLSGFMMDEISLVTAFYIPVRYVNGLKEKEDSADE